MADRDILDRIDEHMARGNEHMARGNELMARFIELHEDNRRFTRDLLRRNERVLTGVTDELRELKRETVASRQILLDVHEESLAQREAIWVLIDKLREHGLGGRN